MTSPQAVPRMTLLRRKSSELKAGVPVSVWNGGRLGVSFRERFLIP
ncbi:MAG: hypothetical protein LBS60_11920 [Deltaproteobacteria bacterium]|nr:hypothetical protein [Deltaproteobacteria bacterium]